MTSRVQSTRMLRISRRTALGMIASAGATPAFAQMRVPRAFPKRPMTLIVPFTPGGPVDLLGRILAQNYQDRSGVSAVVENKTGGAGNIGIETVQKAAPDGTTLLLVPAGNLTINPTLMRNLSFNVERDFAPVAMLASAPNLFVVSRKLGITTIKELLDKTKTTKLSYGSPGVGSQLHLAMELFKEKTGVDIAHVPYRGSSQALGDLLGGHLDILSTNLTAVIAEVQAKTLVPLAMTTAQRSPVLPDVPTLAEAGVPGIDITSWYGLLAPKAISDDIRDAIYTVTKDVLEQPEIRGKLLAQALTVEIEAPDTFAARMRRETAMWADVINKRNITSQ